MAAAAVAVAEVVVMGKGSLVENALDDDVVAAFRHSRAMQTNLDFVLDFAGASGVVVSEESVALLRVASAAPVRLVR